MPQEKKIAFRKEKDVTIDEDNYVVVGKAVVENHPIIQGLLEWTKAKQEDNNKYIQGLLLSDRLSDRALGALLGENRALEKSFKAFLRRSVSLYKTSIGEKGKVVDTNKSEEEEEEETEV